MSNRCQPFPRAHAYEYIHSHILPRTQGGKSPMWIIGFVQYMCFALDNFHSFYLVFFGVIVRFKDLGIL